MRDHNDIELQRVELTDEELETVAAGMLTLGSGIGTTGLADKGIGCLINGLVNGIATTLNVGGQR